MAVAAAAVLDEYGCSDQSTSKNDREAERQWVLITQTDRQPVIWFADSEARDDARGK
jgi:hypothetical protein